MFLLILHDIRRRLRPLCRFYFEHCIMSRRWKGTSNSYLPPPLMENWDKLIWSAYIATVRHSSSCQLGRYAICDWAWATMEDVVFHVSHPYSRTDNKNRSIKSLLIFGDVQARLSMPNAWSTMIQWCSYLIILNNSTSYTLYSNNSISSKHGCYFWFILC